MKTLKSKSKWPFFAAFIILPGFLATPLAQTPAQPEAPMTLAQALAAFAQARAQAKVDFQSVTDCRPLTGPARAQCNHEATAQIVAINRRLADANKAVKKAEIDGTQKANEAVDARRAQAEADRQAAIAANAERQKVAAAQQVANSSSHPQTKVERDLVAAGAAYAQAKIQAENEKKTIMDCRPYTGKEKFDWRCAGK
jgi:hypothetical protein